MLKGRTGWVETEGSILSRHSSPFNDFAANQMPLVGGAAAKEVEMDVKDDDDEDDNKRRSIRTIINLLGGIINIHKCVSNKLIYHFKTQAARDD